MRCSGVRDPAIFGGITNLEFPWERVIGLPAEEVAVAQGVEVAVGWNGEVVDVAPDDPERNADAAAVDRRVPLIF